LGGTDRNNEEPSARLVARPAAPPESDIAAQVRCAKAEAITMITDHGSMIKNNSGRIHGCTGGTT
jgi:hypothetical protein